MRKNVTITLNLAIETDDFVPEDLSEDAEALVEEISTVWDEDAPTIIDEYMVDYEIKVK